MILASIIDPGKLLEVVLAALVAGVGVSALFGLAVLSLARVGEHRRDGGPALAGYLLVATLALAGCLAAIVYGVVLLARK